MESVRNPHTPVDPPTDFGDREVSKTTPERVFGETSDKVEGVLREVGTQESLEPDGVVVCPQRSGRVVVGLLSVGSSEMS